MPRPIILGVVGDSATGKTTLSRGLVRMLGESNVTHVAADDYHRYDRRQRAEHQITPLHPDCNYVDIMERHFAELRAGNAILKPVYQHKDGTFGPPVYTKPMQFTLIEGLLGYHTEALRDSYDVRVFLAPPEKLRRAWKVQRDCSRRGYTTDQVLEELDRREPDSELYIRPQQRWADLVVSFMPGSRGDQEHLDAEITRTSASSSPRAASRSTRASTSTSSSCRVTSIPRAARRSRRRSGRRCTSPATCAPSASASSPSARSCTAPSRWRSSRSSCSTTS